MQELSIGQRKIGGKHPCFVIAEMSCNHLGDFKRAQDIVRAAATAGVDAVKLQTFKPSSLTLDCDGEDFVIHSNNQWNGRRLFDLYKEVYTPWEWHSPLKKMVEDLGMVFLSSAFDEDAVVFLETLSTALYKIASFELTHVPLLQAVARTGKPIILSTGMATLGEIDQAVRTIRGEGNEQIALLRCISNYPAKPETTNISTISHLGTTFGVVSGFSDHTLGSATSIAAVALGAKIIEKHVTLNRNDGGPDAFFSMEPAELKGMVDALHIAESAVGVPTYGPSQNERQSLAFRRSIYAVQDILPGMPFTRDNLRVIRPEFGLAPKYFPSILGRKAKANINLGDPLRWDLVE